MYIVHMVTDKYEGYHFKIANRCDKSAGECYSAPFKYSCECEKISMAMIKEGRV